MRADVVILGGGLTGLACAKLLADQAAAGGRALEIIVVDAAAAPTDIEVAAPLGLRVVALSPASLAVLGACGAWPVALSGRVGHCRRMRVWQGEGDAAGANAVGFDAAELGRTELMCVVENDLLRSALWRACGATAGIRLLSGHAATAVAITGTGVQITLDDGNAIETALVVGAEGHDSWLRRTLGVPVTDRDFGQTAIIAHVTGERPHGDTAWQRFLPDGPLALLPLGDGRSSIVWSAATVRAAELMALPDADFDAALTAASGGVRGALALATSRHALPLAAHHASQYTGLRYALIGDAAHRIHPLAGQGANLGLADAAALAEAVATHVARPGADVGDPLALRRYERWRKAANLTTLSAMNAFHAVFTSRAPGVAAAAGRMLGLVDRLAPVKRGLARQAMGVDGP